MKRFIKAFMFPITGLLSLAWFLFRVIPKPSRAAYPCMKAAAPIALSFVLYLAGLFSSVFVFKKAKKFFQESRNTWGILAVSLGLILVIGSLIQQSSPIHAMKRATLEPPNQPMGEGVGVNPGRVAWIHNLDATDENCSNTEGDYWYQDDNTDQEVMSSMLSQGLQLLTGESSDAAAWDAIFHYYNRTHGRGDVGYTAGEKIVIKINLNGFSNSNWERNINTSPQICYAVLNQLINIVGVAQANIGIGDPGKGADFFLSKCKTKFPSIKFWVELSASQNKVFFSSNGGWETPPANEAWNCHLPQVYEEAAYMINIPVFKKHHRAGISLAAKNHIGSIFDPGGTGQGWHLSFPCTDGSGEVSNGDYGVYRTFVDIMGHKYLGGKTILYIIDGIWGSTNWGHPPVKWQMSPFNNDWPNSLFLSQDPVAIESVGFDFLYYEFDENNPFEGGIPNGDKGPYPHFAGVDDYLHQAADSLDWPQGLVYDPEHDGIPLPRSLGTHEHWNNALDKQYSRNLGLNKGIELISNINTSVEISQPLFVKGFSLEQNYPNPFNPTTTIGYSLSRTSRIKVSIYNLNGQLIKTLVDQQQAPGDYTVMWDATDERDNPVSSGTYIYCLKTKDRILQQKMLLVR